MTFSVIVCAFNEEQLLPGCLHSLLQQSFLPHEIIVINNASTDRTAAVASIRGIRVGALSVACHPHHRTTTRMEIATCYLWDHRKELASLVDVWEAANRDDLFSVTSLKHYPYVANSDFHKAKHLYLWKTLVRSAKTWPAVKAALKSNVDIAITLYRKDSC